MLLKEVKVKSLVSGDKSGRVTLETLYPEDVDKIAGLSGLLEVVVSFRTNDKTNLVSTKQTVQN